MVLKAEDGSMVTREIMALAVREAVHEHNDSGFAKTVLTVENVVVEGSLDEGLMNGFCTIVNSEAVDLLYDSKRIENVVNRMVVICANWCSSEHHSLTNTKTIIGRHSVY
jgi:hypothetical protein